MPKHLLLGSCPHMAALVIAASAPRLSSAQEPERQEPIVVAFEYQAPSGCLNEDQAFSLLHRRSRRVHRESSSAEQRLDMKIVSDASGYRGVLTVTRAGQAPERRSMTGGSCDEVVEALALTAALSIDPEATVTLGPEAPRVGEEPVSRATSPDDGESSAETAWQFDEELVQSPSDARLQVNLGPVLTLTRLMDHTLHVGGGAVFALSRPSPRTWLSVEARLSVYYLRETTAAGGPGIETSILASRLAYCPLGVGDDLSLHLCPVLQLGALSAQSRGFSEDSRTTRFFATWGLEAWSRARLSRQVDLWVAPALEAPLTERSFAVDPGPEILVSTVSLGWSISAGVGWSF